MPGLLFFSRVALLCNVCFLATFFMHYIPGLRDGHVSSTLIVLGSVLAVVLNAILNLLYGLLLLAGRLRLTKLPLWLVVANFLFFVFQLILILK